MPPRNSQLAKNVYDYFDVRRPVLDSTCFEPLELADKFGANYYVATPAQPYASILPLLTDMQTRALRTPKAVNELEQRIKEQPHIFPAERTILSSSLSLTKEGIKNTPDGTLYFAETEELESESVALSAGIRATENFASTPRAQILIARVAFKSMQYNAQAVTRVRDIIQAQLEELHTPLTLGPAEVYIPRVAMPPAQNQ